MQIRVFKYLSPLTIYLAAFFAFSERGWLTWLPLIYAWIIVPVTELFIKPDSSNLSKAEEEMAKQNRWYDFMLYIIVPAQFAALVYFLFSMQEAGLTTMEIMGRIGCMGLLCGTFGINVAHELGHRHNIWEQWMAKMLLATSLYVHFFIEHNKGHHKNVATPQDPSSARLNEPIYFFFPRTIIYSYLSAWHIANDDCRKKGRPVVGLHNEMIQAHFIHLLIVAAIAYFFGALITLYFIIAAFIGILLLETVNYIEHYGLVRKRYESGKYERTLPQHSWNSDHPIGRIMLFELSRHSDHHYLASRKYQVLQHHDNAPQLPAGYPGSMLLSLVPPLWFFVMNRKIKRLVE